MTLKTRFISQGRKADTPANPAFPDGINVNMCGIARECCSTELPYPAECVGSWHITCDACTISVLITAAGRRDDPRWLYVACMKNRKEIAA